MIKRIKAAIGTIAVATLLAFGAGTTPALADHQSHGQWQRSDSQRRPGNQGPRYVGNQNGWRQSQRHGNRHHGHNRHQPHHQRHHNNRHHYGHNQRAQRHGYRHRGNRHHHRHHRHYGHYGYHVNGRDIAGAIIGGVVIYHLGRSLFGHH